MTDLQKFEHSIKNYFSQIADYLHRLILNRLFCETILIDANYSMGLNLRECCGAPAHALTIGATIAILCALRLTQALSGAKNSPRR
jgi:hypothetical protein